MSVVGTDNLLRLVAGKCQRLTAYLTLKYGVFNAQMQLYECHSSFIA
jgi:hypothetical protein